MRANFAWREPTETGLSPSRQMALLRHLDSVARGETSQAVVATHSPILMSHPIAQILWIDENGIHPRDLDDVDHWNATKGFMRNPGTFLRRLLED